MAQEASRSFKPRQLSSLEQSSTWGFSIVELLIVIAVIAILAAITIVAYNGIQGSTYDSTVESDLRSAQTKLELAKIDRSDGTYAWGNSPTVNNGYSLPSIGLHMSENAYARAPDVEINFLLCMSGSRDKYALLATSKSGTRYYIRESGSVVEYTGSTSWAGSDIVAMCSALDN